MTSWTRRPPPVSSACATEAWRGQPGSPAELTRLRQGLRAALRSRGLPSGADVGERLLLAFEELVSNGLRHGRPPVRVCVTAVGGGWLLEVSDAAADRPPVPAADRDPAQGGMGLDLVARISGAHGWAVEDERKIVWARVDCVLSPDPLLCERVRAATECTRDLAAQLTVRAAQAAATLEGLAVAAAGCGRPDAARRRHAAAQRAQLVVERVCRVGLGVPRTLAA